MPAQHSSVDAVVVGAGHNGLVAANLLADAGWQVTVVEAAPTPGGAVRSAELAAPGYLSDICSAFYPLAVQSPVLQRLRLAEFGLSWRHAPDVLAHILPDDRVALLGREPSRTAQSVEAFAEGDGDRWHASYEQWQAMGARLLGAVLGPFPPVRPSLRLLRALRVAGTLRLARRMVLPAQVLAEELFAGQGARLLLAGCAMHTDLGPQEAGSGIFGWLLAMVAQQSGFPVAHGGAGRITDALVARLRRSGGELVCGARADRIEVMNGRAVAVSSADGRRWRARRAVLADVPAPVLYLDLVVSKWLPPMLLRDLEHFRWDGSTVKVDWALSRPVPWRNQAAAAAGTVHLGTDLRGLTRYAAELAAQGIPADPFVIAGQMTTADPSRSPAGTETLWAYSHLPHKRDWAAAEVADYAEKIQATIERHAPGFGSSIVGRHISGPADLEAENPSLVGGAIGGGTSAAYQQLFWRPIPGLGRADTPVDRLFLASSSAHPGGGVHGGPGANAARAALARDRAGLGRIYRAGVKAAHRAVYE